MTDNIFTLQKIDEKLKDCLSFLENITVRISDDDINKFSVARYGNNTNIIILSNGLTYVRLFEKITEDEVIVEGKPKGKISWREVK